MVLLVMFLWYSYVSPLSAYSLYQASTRIHHLPLDITVCRYTTPPPLIEYYSLSHSLSLSLSHPTCIFRHLIIIFTIITFLIVLTIITAVALFAMLVWTCWSTPKWALTPSPTTSPTPD